MEYKIKREDEAAHGGVLVELLLADTTRNFSLQKAVCSNGLFMMAPNHWDPLSKTLKRPLRLDPDDDEISVMVHVSHPPHSPHALHLRVFAPHALSPQHQQYLQSQVRRMLRLSEEENRRVIEFHKVHEDAKERGFGRLFRSPTLFEDMVKCILLCNCQWSRTLRMAQALSELQAELQHASFSASNVMAETGNVSSCQTNEIKPFAPRTPLGKESKKKTRVRKHSKKLAKQYAEVLGVEEAKLETSTAEILECYEETGVSSPTFPSRDVSKRRPLEVTENDANTTFGNFPSPRELANLDVMFLAKRCNLGYRASRVINLARGVIEGQIQLQELEYACETLSLSDYDKLAEKLRMIDGFGPFTCSNVLMCMGYYHVIPTDSETVRHLQQVHAKTSSNRTVQGDVEDIYRKYVPFQFLAYWFEVWLFYEKKFGNLCEMPHSSYKLITAANMRLKQKRKVRMKLALGNIDDGYNEKMEV